MYHTKAYAAHSPNSGLSLTTIPRRDPGERDVQVEVLYCGICHSDLHHVRDEFQPMMPTTYPYVPGHEIIGRVAAVGSSVTVHAGIAAPAMSSSAQTLRSRSAGLIVMAPLHKPMGGTHKRSSWTSTLCCVCPRT
jgi:D-arabinose 1-dehydrogenase-like Zn-dependent alcohol dehydrogenase